MEKDILENLVGQGNSTREIAQIVNKSQTTICYWLNKYKLITTPYKPENQCFFCGKNIRYKKYCNAKCQQGYQWKQRKKQIEKTGKIMGVVSGKRYLKEVIGDICKICGLKKWNGKNIIMIMDHIDGDSSNNFLTNLRLICPNCDSQLPTFKNRNKGNGRHLRRQRYLEGKSY